MSSYKGGRKLFGATIVLQDWDEPPEERSAQYWELFLDLLLVAAASCVADQYKEDENLLEFVSFALILVNGWMLYTHHVTTRFEDSSLSHSMLLFVYFVGFGYAIVNIGYEHATAFAAGALLQRVALTIMLAYTAYTVPRARYACSIITSIMVTPMICFVTILWLGSDDDDDRPVIPIVALAVAAAAEFFVELFLTLVVDRMASVPVNIEHTKDRLGALQLVMLGETASSVTLVYRETLAKAQDNVERTAEKNYYWVLILAFLLIFMFTLLFFHMQPRAEDHAFRRSVNTYGIGLILHKSLSLTFLALGVSIKVIVEAVLLREELSAFGYQLLGYGVGGALLILYMIRLLHHGNRPTLQFSTGLVWVKGADPAIDRIPMIWWTIVGLAWIPPLVGVATDLSPHDPLTATAVHALYVFMLCLIESTLSHVFGEKLAANLAARHAAVSSGEQQALVQHDKSSFGAIDEDKL